jgi:hypothetical protein
MDQSRYWNGGAATPSKHRSATSPHARLTRLIANSTMIADRGVDDRTDDAPADVDAQPRQR